MGLQIIVDNDVDTGKGKQRWFKRAASCNHLINMLNVGIKPRNG